MNKCSAVPPEIREREYRADVIVVRLLLKQDEKRGVMNSARTLRRNTKNETPDSDFAADGRRTAGAIQHDRSEVRRDQRPEGGWFERNANPEKASPCEEGQEERRRPGEHCARGLAYDACDSGQQVSFDIGYGAGCEAGPTSSSTATGRM
jgi:hypothetical protein